MRAAFATWNERIAPVFDVARQVHIVEAGSGRVSAEHSELPLEDAPARTALRLAELGVDTLVCGAISRPVHDMVEAYGIRVIPFVAGDLTEVIQAWQSGLLQTDAFAMPGCRHRARGGRGGGRGKGGGRGRGRQKGDGRRRRARGGREGPEEGEAAHIADCVCPGCGQREPGRANISCTERRCPRCGTTMESDQQRHSIP